MHSGRKEEASSGSSALKLIAGSSSGVALRQGQAELADGSEVGEHKLGALVQRQMLSPPASLGVPSSAGQSIYNRSTRGLFQQQSQLIDANHVFEMEEEISKESDEASSGDPSSEDSASSSDGSSHADVDNVAVHEVTEEMEMYYDTYFKGYEVLTLPADPEKQQKVWHVFFDVTYDIVYNFLAKIHVS